MENWKIKTKQLETYKCSKINLKKKEIRLTKTKITKRKERTVESEQSIKTNEKW